MTTSDVPASDSGSMPVVEDESTSAAENISTDAGNRGRRAAPVPRPFPRRTLEQALRVPKAIKEMNGGQPWKPSEVAAALSMGGGTSSAFFYLTTSARDFGLTLGARDSAEISITDLGRAAIAPSFPGEQEAAIRQAFLSVDLFRRVVEHYGGSTLPEEPFRTNTLTQTFDLDSSIVTEFVDLFEKNARFAKVGSNFTQDVAADPAGSVAGRPQHAVSGAQPLTQDLAAPASGSASGLVCFVAMPFTEHTDERPIGFFEEVLTSLLTPAIAAAGFTVRTAKRQGSDIIQSTIVTELLEADLVVADLTEHNPNVLFELGMRMNADKPVALIRAKGTGAIFDVDHMLRVEDYNPNLWPSTVSKDVASLTAHIKAAWDDRESSATFMKILRGNA